MYSLRKKNIYRRTTIIASLALMLTACSTVSNVTAPFVSSAPNYSDIAEEPLREIALEIERGIMEGNREPELTNRGGVTIDTPIILQAARTRAARSHLVSAFLDTGHGWERRRGRLWIIRSSEYKKSGTRQSKDIDALMVNGENRDRWTLYEEIIDVNNYPNRALSAIEEIFFEARLSLMKPGQKYEAEDGEPVAK